MISGWWFPKEELDPESIAFAMLFGGGAEITRPMKIGADAWFDFRSVERFEIQEQSFHECPRPPVRGQYEQGDQHRA